MNVTLNENDENDWIPPCRLHITMNKYMAMVEINH